MAKKKYIRPKPKVGSFVIIREPGFRHIAYEGIVVESFSDLTILYGLDHRGALDFHRIDEEEIEVKPIEKEKFQFELDQCIREIEAKKIKAEISFNNLKREMDEALLKRKEYLGIDSKPLGVL